MRRSALIFAFAAAAAVLCAGSARADQVFCAATIHWITPATPSLTSDTTFDVVIRAFGAGEITHARLAVLDGEREYEVDVPVEGNATVVDEHDELPVTQFRSIALHFAKPLTVQAVWLENIGDDRGDSADCLANPTIPVENADPKLTKIRAEFDEDARKNPLDVRVPAQDGIKFITPENCVHRYVDARAVSVVTPAFPDAAKQSLLGAVTVLVRVNLKPDGEIAAAFVQQSSGNMWIDKAAVDAALRTTYAPKKIDCLPFAGSYLFRATFDPNM